MRLTIILMGERNALDDFVERELILPFFIALSTSRPNEGYFITKGILLEGAREHASTLLPLVRNHPRIIEAKTFAVVLIDDLSTQIYNSREWYHFNVDRYVSQFAS